MLLAGMNYIGNSKKSRKVNEDIIMDDYKQSPYHSNACKKMSKEYNNMYKKNTDSAKYMTSSDYVDDEGDIMGAGTNYAGDIESSFLDQFELPTAKNQKIRASNEGKEGRNSMSCIVNKWANFEGEGDDMTLGVVDKDSKEFFHNNMHQFNRMRDFADPDYEDNRPLEMFTGYSENYIPKREMAPLFKPVKNNVIQDSALTTLEEERMQDVIGIRRNGDKPFEPKQNAPILSLDETQEFGFGGRDTTRIEPYNGGNLRRVDKQQVSYTEPMMHGKKGSKRPIMPHYEKRKTTLIEENRENFANGGRQGLKAREQIDLQRKNNRKNSSSVINPKGGNYRAFDPRTQGQVKHSEKSIYKGQIGAGSMPTKRAQINEKSIHINDTQRMHTNHEFKGTATGTQRSANLSKNEKIRGKHNLERAPDGHAQRGNQGHASTNYNEKIHGKQFLERAPDGQIQRGNQGQYNGNYKEPVRTTVKQTTLNPVYGYLAGHDAVKTGLMDDVRKTVKQGTVVIPEQGFIAGHHANQTQLMDDARRTVKQGTLYDHDGYMSGINAQQTQLMDDVRRTIKQGTVQNNYQGPLGQHLNQGYLNDKVTAPTTIKETTEMHNFMYNPGTSTLNVNNPVDATNITVPFATKQFTLQQDYMGHAGNDNMAMDQSQFYNGHMAEKDLLAIGRAPTMANVSAIPTAIAMGQIEIPDYQSYDYVGLANNPGNMYNPDITVMERNMPYYGDNIGQYGTLDSNPYVNTDYYGYK